MRIMFNLLLPLPLLSTHAAAASATASLRPVRLAYADWQRIFV
jgi:hypothetical protein